MDRRIFLKLLGLGNLWHFYAGCAGKVSYLDRPPNLLLILVDDLNDWVLRPSGHPIPKIPNIDRLVKKSINFRNAHVVVPVCGPSRKCLFSGLYPQQIDDYGFALWKSVPALENCLPLPLHFRQQGYDVYGTGKLFHEGAGGDFYTAYGTGPDYGPWPWKGSGSPKYTAHPYQFLKWEQYLPEEMHRDLNYGPLTNIPNWKPDSSKSITGAKGWYNTSGEPFHYKNDQDRDLMPDEIYTRWAIERLLQQKGRPFFLSIGFIRPHTPLYVPQCYFDRFPIETIDLPPYLENDLDDCAKILRNRWQWGYQKFEALIQAGGIQAWKEWVQAYLASIAFVDDQIGKILDTLENCGFSENTIVILTGDNGYHIGEKDCIQKWHLWNESTRVPLLIHVPQAKGNGHSCDHPVSLIDLYPTVIDLCGLPKNPNANHSGIPLAGFSLRPFLYEPNLNSWTGPPVALMAVRDGEENPHFSVCSHRYRYTLCANGEQELYDHSNDPNEWTNLASDKKNTPVCLKLRREMYKIFKKTSMPPGFF